MVEGMKLYERRSRHRNEAWSQELERIRILGRYLQQQFVIRVWGQCMLTERKNRLLVSKISIQSQK